MQYIRQLYVDAARYAVTPVPMLRTNLAAAVTLSMPTL